jgi:hypothetical protein
VRIEIFTLNFRKVVEETLRDVPPGTAVTIELKDRWGRPLANGLYYVFVSAGGRHEVQRLLILR